MYDITGSQTSGWEIADGTAIIATEHFYKLCSSYANTISIDQSEIVFPEFSTFDFLLDP